MFEFEWDINKAESNFKKHGISFEEAATAFDDYFALYMEDINHSVLEQRYLLIGYTINNRIVVLSYTERNEIFRLISARLATKRERKVYEEKR
ncbi:MAG: hypothetical protein A2X61_07250 [Ignavibacteria bacterium GWB2_35_12]|nr:MAG: hypothetical protein A2X61_07250 [Ignavibacteria bacterium GWB2_35_12]OGU89471.1 MAG: hypothetical protein A2220_10995 [Ignavibacteria bacterium RIFOXYA2_FULL_35_10]OGV21157.1 MAG: hypothetical protein A2475_01350 [Ignavibacteria bacterium RIFOXYC2_FULL_35_21]